MKTALVTGVAGGIGFAAAAVKGADASLYRKKHPTNQAKTQWAPATFGNSYNL